METRISSVLLEADIDSANARISSVLLEADIDSTNAHISSVLMEIDTDSRQGAVSSVLIEIDVLNLSDLLLGRNDDKEYITGFLFRDVNIPKDSVVQEAYLRLYSIEAQYPIKCSLRGSLDPRLYGWFDDNKMPADVYPMTAGSALIISGSLASEDWIQSEDLYCVIQEIVSQDIWTSGCTIGIIAAGDYPGYGFHKVRKGPHAQGAKLDVTWLEP